MIDRLEILAAKLRYLVSRNRWSTRLLRAPVIRGHADEPGLVMIQIDGLGERVLRRALDEDRMPFLRHLVRDEGYEIRGLYAGVPSNTPAFQGELFYGVPGAVPGFGFVDKQEGRPMAMLQQPAAALIEGRLAARERGLLAGGSSWSNIYTGGAAEAHFCCSTAGFDVLLRAVHPLRMLGLLVWHGWSIVRVVANLLLETALAFWDFARGAIAGRDLRMELRFVPERVLVSAVLREIVTAGACIDAERGVPIVHLNFLGYDEHAHRRGPDSRFALWTLRGIDRAIRRIWLAAHRSRHRDYRIWIYSDHGQERVRPWPVVHGEDVAEAIRRVWREVLEHPASPSRDGAHVSLDAEASTSGPRHARRRRRPMPMGGRTGRTSTIREELPGWWSVGGGAVPLVEPPSEPVPVGEPTIIHRGAIGFVYVPAGFDRLRLAEVARAIAQRAKVPTVLVADGPGAARVWTHDGGEYRLPGDEDAVFGSGHPHREWALADSLRLVSHESAGDIVLWSWHPREPYSFKVEAGAHGGPGPRETGAMVVLPPETGAHIPKRPLRPSDLRELARDALDPRRPRMPPRRRPEIGDVPAPARVMTYNVHGCRGMDGRYSVERITRVIARAHPDIVCLQEVDQGRGRSGGLDQVREIATRLAKTYRFHAVSEVDDGRFGNAVLSSHPLQFVESGPLPAVDARLGLEPRGALWVEVDLDGRKLQVINTHLSILSRERRLQVRELLRWIERASARGALVLTGDLNSSRDSYVGQTLASVLHDVVEPHALQRIVRTWSGRVPLLRIDHVFASSGLSAKHVHVPRTRLARVASDHLPVIVDLEEASSGSSAKEDAPFVVGLDGSPGPGKTAADSERNASDADAPARGMDGSA